MIFPSYICPYISISVLSTFPETRTSPTKLEYKKSEIAEVQYQMCEALARGNINSVGHHAWYNLIHNVQDIVVEYINNSDMSQFPQFIKEGKPNFIYTKTFKNCWDICYGYMTTCVKPDELEQWYILASDEPPPQELQNQTEQRQNAKECARTLANVWKNSVITHVKESLLTIVPFLM